MKFERADQKGTNEVVLYKILFVRMEGHHILKLISFLDYVLYAFV